MNPIISKRAKLSDIFKQNTTLYYHKKNKKFLAKTAQIDVVLVFKEEKKVAGFVKLDLANYPNNNLKSNPEF